MAHDVFISYSAEDKPIADAVCAALEAKHIRCWIAPRDVLPGRDYAETLIEAIRDAGLMLLVFSSNSNRSPHVMREVERAASRGIPILPFRIEDVPPCASMEYYISSTHWLDALTPPLERHLGHLADTVHILLERSGRLAAVAAGPEATVVAPDAASSVTEAPIDTLQATAAEAGAKADELEAMAAAAATGAEEKVRAAAKATAEAKAAEKKEAEARPARLEGGASGIRPWCRRHKVPLVAVGAGVLTAAVIFLILAVVVRPGSGDKDGATGSITTTTTMTKTGTSASATTIGPTVSTEIAPKIAWKLDVGGGESFSPAVLDGVVYCVGPGARSILAVDAKSREVWDSGPFGADILVKCSPAVSQGSVYFQCDDGYLRAIDLGTGVEPAERWKYQTGGGNSTPVISDGVVYCGGEDGRLHAVDAATGQCKWKVQTGGPIKSSATISGGVVYFCSHDGQLRAVDAATGTLKWGFDVQDGIWSSPAVWDRWVYFGSDNGYFYAVNAVTGQEEWRFRMGLGTRSSPVVSNELVYWGSDDKCLYAAVAGSGEKKWQFETGGAVETTPFLSDGSLYFGSDDGFVYAVDPGTGQEIWEFQTGAPVLSSPVVWDGMAYFAAGHDLHALVLPTVITAAWTHLDPAGDLPPARTNFCTACHQAIGRVILFGGLGGDAYLNDTWAYDPAANEWVRLDPSGVVPGARDGHAMIFESGREAQRVLLFGGDSLGGPDIDYNDTWAYDAGANVWTDLHPAGAAPAPRVNHCMAYHPNTGKVILFGGTQRSTCFGDTWAYDPSANLWTDLRPAGVTPSARAWASMVYDPHTDLVIMFGGYDRSTVYNDTWAYDPVANTWTDLDPAGDVPSARLNCGMVHDSANDRLILFGGEDSQGDLADTWVYDSTANTWTRLDTPATPPPGCETSSLVYDPATSKAIVFGSSSGGASLDQTWAFGR